MSYNLFLDDVRNPNTFLKDIRTWVVVRTYSQFVKTISELGLPKFISFDHDLADEHFLSVIDGEHYEGVKWSNLSIEEARKVPMPYDKFREKTGYHCAKWLTEYCMDHNLPLPNYQVHSHNPVGAENIMKLLEGFRTQWKPKNN